MERCHQQNLENRLTLFTMKLLPIKKMPFGEKNTLKPLTGTGTSAAGQGVIWSCPHDFITQGMGFGRFHFTLWNIFKARDRKMVY
jgi:hypothetical protein